MAGTVVIAAGAASAAPASGLRAASPVYVEPGASPVAQPDWQARDWAMACMTCHNASAPVSVGKATLPALEGRPVTELMTALQAMRDGQRAATLMPQLLKGYRDDELRRIAAYFASQPANKGASASPRTPQTSR
ncbi:Cytochrome subunit of sulfide dehydrogenase [Pandoraea eparura]|uniref:Cytochrome subunit of sulfide dehydrogenase n=1 Tax=Pandoraea eparura TaxID=2508291 RepID=A0A5E4W701_9BURK|nr:cytochrome c [Pandoraea eparura]VVE19863.1 Cytochrome subunit of sulfide dehydrogenase [Pandoraea eparura]